jgi:hypothetical protein
MSHATYHVGDVFDIMATLEDGSVDLVLTSPPFLALRSYLPADHPDKGKEIGSEPTPAEFLDTLLALTAEWGRLLAPHGSIAVELGDTYASSGGTTDNREDSAGGNDFAPCGRRGNGPGWPLDKSLCIIPELYAACLAYGRNVLTGEPSPAGQWRVRNLVRWVRPNPPVGALGDKYRPATSTMVVACQARDRWFDLDAVRTEHTEHAIRYNNAEGRARHKADGYVVPERGDGGRMTHGLNPAGAPPLDWWNIPTQPYKGSHYATWPARLCETPIESMCPREVCATCGEPRRRIVKKSDAYEAFRAEQNADYAAGRNEKLGSRANALSQTTPTGAAVGGWNNVDHQIGAAEYETLGWTDCGHDNYRPGIVIDPFAGSGTTLAVATGHGRDAIGIDIDARNADLAVERVGMLLTVEERL